MGMDRIMREVEQGGANATTSLLVTRGHVELEVFTEPAGLGPKGLSGATSHGPVGEYVGSGATRSMLQQQRRQQLLPSSPAVNLSARSR